jgi:hypothetical protein
MSEEHSNGNITKKRGILIKSIVLLAIASKANTRTMMMKYNAKLPVK